MSSDCSPGSCTQFEVEVCPSGCSYTTINAAIGSFSPGSVGSILVHAGTYPELVDLTNRAGTCECPARIHTDGTVTIDGRITYTGTWTQYSANTYYTSFVTSEPDQSQLFVNDTRYTYIPGSSFTTLAADQYAYDATPGAQRLYANFGGLSPGSQAIAISTRLYGFDLNEGSAYLTIEGFTVLGTRHQGFHLKGTALQPVSNVTVKGCTSEFNGGQGVYLEHASSCTVESCNTHDNGRHGIYLWHSQDCQVTRNESFRNNDPRWPGITGNMTGIKIGDSADSADVSLITVDYNVVHHNEDTGIAMRGARKILLRRNVSYRNGDHGYDNDESNQTVFLNNVAALNDHDGISVEDKARNDGFDGLAVAVVGGGRPAGVRCT